MQPGALKTMHYVVNQVVFPATNVERRIDRDRVREQIGIWDYDPSSIVGLDDGCTSLNLFHGAFIRVQLDLIPYTKWFSPEQQQAGQEILQYILKSKSNGHAADAENLD